jgi:large subunit ribosomal protein L23
MRTAHDIIRRPIITEKASDAKDKQNKVTFVVEGDAGKPEIKSAVEEIFKVKVDKINVINTKPKTKRFGRQVGRRPGYKKAIITLKQGDTIEVFDQV